MLNDRFTCRVRNAWPYRSKLHEKKMLDLFDQPPLKTKRMLANPERDSNLFIETSLLKKFSTGSCYT